MLEEKINKLKEKYEALKNLTEIYKVRIKSFEELSKIINSNVNLEDALNITLDLILKLFQVPSGSIMLLTLDGKNMEISVARGDKADKIKEFKVEIGKGIAGKVAETGQPIIVNDTEKSPDFNREIGEKIDYVPKNILCVPIKIKEKVLGVIEIMDKPGDETFNDDDLNLLTSIGNTLGIVIENVNLYRLAETNVERLSTLIDVSKVINTTMDLYKLLEYIMETAKKVLKAEGSSLMLIDEEKQELYFNIATGDEKDKLKEIRVPIGTGVAGLVAQNGEPLLIEDAVNDPRVFKGVDEKTKIVTRNILAVPMRVKNKIVGVLEAINAIDKPCFDKNDLQLFQAFADHAGIAIYNRDLINSLKDANTELERRFKEIKAMYEINKRLTTETEVDNAFKIGTEVISNIFELNRVSIMVYDETRDGLMIKSSVGIRKDLADKILVKRGENIAGKVFQNEKPVIVKDMDKERIFGRNKRFRYKTKSFISVPLKIRRKVIGVLNVTDKKDGEPFTDNEFLTMTTIADQIAKNYENIMYYNEVLEKHRLEKEIEITRNIQQHVLPKKFPKIAGLDIAATSIPAKEVGGDFYDYIKINDLMHGFLIADVSGKSLPASMFMAFSRSITRVEAYNLISPAKVLEESNKYIFKDSESGMFVTMFYMVCSLDDKVIEFGSAGHNEQLLYKPESDSFISLKVKGIPLGISPDSKYMEDKISYADGDILVLYTDGVTEAINTSGDEFGLDNLKTVVSKSKDLTAKEILDNILKSVSNFTGGAPQFDDITLLIIKFGNKV